MQQKICSTTRVTSKSETLIDHIWVSSNCRIGRSGTTDGKSDHHAIYAEMLAPMETTVKKIRTRTYKGYDRNKLAKEYKEVIQQSRVPLTDWR